MPEAKKSNSLKRSLGALLRARRKEMGMTLTELAEKAELSAAFISQAERGKATPSIVSLINIAKSLGTDINYFITPPEPTTLVKRADNPQYLDIGSPVTYSRLDSNIRNQRMNILMMTIPPGTSLPVVHRDEGEDFFYILEGEIQQIIGGDVFTLKKGDSAHHNTQVDHSCSNTSDKDCVLLWAGTPILFPEIRNPDDK